MTSILIVDDDVQAAETLALMFEISGHDTDLAHDARQAIDAWSLHRHRVVFLDLGLADTDGYAVARMIRDAQELDAPLMVALTGQSSEVIALTRESGFDAYLQKPATASALFAHAARVEQALPSLR